MKIGPQVYVKGSIEAVEMYCKAVFKLKIMIKTHMHIVNYRLTVGCLWL